MTLPWLPDGYHIRALQLIDRAPAPFIPPSSAPRPCGIKWCAAFADKKSGWPVEGPRRVTHDGVIESRIYAHRCSVHRHHADYRPRERRFSLGRVWSAIDRTSRKRRHAA